MEINIKKKNLFLDFRVRFLISNKNSNLDNEITTFSIKLSKSLKKKKIYQLDLSSVRHLAKFSDIF